MIKTEEISKFKTPHEFITAVTSLSVTQQKILAQQLAWKLSQGTTEDKRKLKEALNVASMHPY